MEIAHARFQSLLEWVTCIHPWPESFGLWNYSCQDVNLTRSILISGLNFLELHCCLLELQIRGVNILNFTNETHWKLPRLSVFFLEMQTARSLFTSNENIMMKFWRMLHFSWINKMFIVLWHSIHHIVVVKPVIWVLWHASLFSFWCIKYQPSQCSY